MGLWRQCIILNGENILEIEMMVHGQSFLQYGNELSTVCCDTLHYKNNRLELNDMIYPDLTDREKMLMKCIWKLGDGTRLAYMVEAANAKFDLNWKPQTASTFLNKLVLKGFVEPYREGQYVHYRIVVSEEEYLEQVIRQEVEFWIDGDATVYFANFLRSGAVSAKDKDALKKMLLDLINE